MGVQRGPSRAQLEPIDGTSQVPHMERVVVVHSMHARAAAADREALRQLAPQARLERLLRMQHA